MALLCGRRGTESPKYSCLPDTELSKIMLRKRRESVSSQGEKKQTGFSSQVYGQASYIT